MSGDFKVKHWKYYNEAGNVLREEEFDENGKLISL